MAERRPRPASAGRLQAIIGAGAALLLVVAGTVWLAVSLGGDDDKSDTAAPAGGAVRVRVQPRCPARAAATPQIKDVGLPRDQRAAHRHPDHDDRHQPRPDHRQGRPGQGAVHRGQLHPPGEKKFFDNTKCHRLVTEGIKVLQCGDPSATGNGWRDTDGTAARATAGRGEPADRQAPAVPGGRHRDGQRRPAGQHRQPVLHRLRRHAAGPGVHACSAPSPTAWTSSRRSAEAGDDGAFAQQAGGGHPKKEVIIKDLTMSDPQRLTRRAHDEAPAG